MLRVVCCLLFVDVRWCLRLFAVWSADCCFLCVVCCCLLFVAACCVLFGVLLVSVGLWLCVDCCLLVVFVLAVGNCLSIAC